MIKWGEVDSYLQSNTLNQVRYLSEEELIDSVVGVASIRDRFKWKVDKMYYEFISKWIFNDSFICCILMFTSKEIVYRLIMYFKKFRLI